MTEEQPEATIQVFKKGGRYYATLNAQTPHGLLTRTGFYVGKATSPSSAVDEILAHVAKTAKRKPGRKPRDYAKCRHVVFGS